jgi:hypothetical protein
VAAPPTAPADAPVAATPTVEADVFDRLGADDLGRLTVGFYFAFWGAFVTMMTLCDWLVATGTRTLHAFVLVAGNVSVLVGTWRLHEVAALGGPWRRRTREALIAAVAAAYLCPFFLMWRRVPVNLYLLGHALGMVAAWCAWLTLSCHAITVLGRTAGKRSFVIQGMLFGLIVVVMLFPPFARVAQDMVLAARDGHDPLAALRFWMQRVPPWWLLALTLPVALVLSLLWAAKDLALHRLLATRDREPPAA